MARTKEEIISGLAEVVEEVTGIEPSEVTEEKSFVDDLDIEPADLRFARHPNILVTRAMPLTSRSTSVASL